MKLVRFTWSALAWLTVAFVVAVAGLLFWLSSPQHSVSTDMQLASTAACPRGTEHEYAIVGAGGKTETVGAGDVAFELKSNSAVRSAGVALTAQSGYVVKAAAIYADARGTQQVGAAKGTDVSKVRVGQLNRSTTVLRADACVGKAGIIGRVAGVAHLLGKLVAVLVLLGLGLVLSAGFTLGRRLSRRQPEAPVVDVPEATAEV